MRSFVAELLPPINAARAIAAIVLDDAGLSPDDIQHGVTVIEVENEAIAAAAVGLIEAAAPPREALVDSWSEYDDDHLAVFTDQSRSDFPSRVSAALQADVPIVLVARRKSLPDDIDNYLDRRIVTPGRLADHQIGRAIFAVAGGGEPVDAVGLGESVTLDDCVKSIRKGYLPAEITARLHKIAAFRQSGQDLKGIKALDAPAKPAADHKADANPERQPVLLRDLSGYGPAKDWGLQLASDVAAFKRGEIGWDDIDKGILLSGPPGTGKTYFANALANECGVRLLVTTYAEWQSEKGGDSVAKGLKQLFDGWRQAAEREKAVIGFVDEIDSIGSRQGGDYNASWFRPIINAWLAFLDGATPRTGIIVIAATNAPEMVDPALLRPGRLDRHVTIPMPTIDDLFGILRHHAGDLDGLRQAAVALRGRSPAEIAQIVRDARRLARRAQRSLTTGDIVDIAQAERPRRTPDEDRDTVYHEAGHALAGYLLGVDVQYVDADRAHNAFKPPAVANMDDIRALLTTYLAGRAANDLFTGGADTGSSADLAMATTLATNTVTKFGLCNSLVVMNDSRAAQDDGVQAQVSQLLDDCYKAARDLLQSRRYDLRRLATALAESRYLDASEIKAIIESRIARLARKMISESESETGCPADEAALWVPDEVSGL